MKFVLLLYGDEAQWNDATPEQLQRSMAEYEAFSVAAEKAGVLAGGEGLETTSSATTVRVVDGEPVLSDGPFAETREQLGGYFVLECADLDEAARWAAKIPDAREGAIEIRPVIDYEAIGSAAPPDQASA